MESIGFDHDGPLVDSFGWADADGEGIASVEHTFDDRWRLATRAISGASEVDFGYSPDGLLTQAGQAQFGHNPQTALLEERTVGDVVTSLTWNDFAELEAMYTDVSGSALFDLDYTYDDEGRITEKVEVVDGESTTFEYDYDGRGRLVEVIRDGVQEASYSYDANDNRTGVTDSVRDLSAADIEHDDQDRLLEYGNLVFSYDERGRLTSVLDTSTSEETFYGYDIRGNLLAVDLPDGRTVRYTADAAGRRVERCVEDADGEEEPDTYRRYVYKDQLNPIAVLDRDGEILQRFVYGSRAHVPDYIVTPDGTFAFVTDHLGSPRLIVDTETGEVVQRMDFDAFGQVIEDTAEGFQPFGFAGGLYEPETGLVRFGARDYDPTTGRWTAKDPIGFDGGDSNLYGYALQDPVNLIDPVGRFSHKFWNSAADVAAGFGDTISFGATRKIRQALDIDAVVDHCSTSYRVGTWAGEAHGLVGGRGFGRIAGRRATNKLASVSRRTCSFTADEVVHMCDGHVLPIDEVEEGELVLSVDRDSGELVCSEVVHPYANSRRQIFEVEVEDSEGLTEVIETYPSGRPRS